MALTTVRRTPAGDADSTSPRRSGTRQSRARLTDVRIWAGLALLVVAAVLGAGLLGRGAETVLVLQATRDLAVGSVPQETDAVAVPTDLAPSYVSADDPIAGRLRWPVSAGELIPRSALSTVEAEPMRGVTVAVQPGHAPASLLPGDLVDVWATPADAGGWSADAADPSLVLADAAVLAVSADAAGFGGGWAVELAVPPSRVGELVAAARGGVLDLVAVPVASQTVQP